MNVYEVIDEPKPGGLSRWTVDPMWPFFAAMLGGTWLGWVWFVVNSLAMDSATKKKELITVSVGVAGSFLLSLALISLFAAEAIPQEQRAYAALTLVVWKLAVSYRLHLWQSVSLELFQYFQPEIKNGAIVAAASFFIGRRLLAVSPESLWTLVLQ